ncbi:PEP-CTERM sorting domain-containing protein [Colwellia sp. BRX9-1]|uniref:PEP-CTERM sorting domain-containing protein n=1 Tax=Colwellia sp. BRX9-1 TaxID=2759830 RepID=UPI0015F53CD3|nr:PEP-CTERM sorting domain-containing protein [Colwellia sp. BRX9-1]MBA6352297.1 PEP-CTERM sorting domain-containing protein [Colwellia sp. BRX9-1]
MIKFAFKLIVPFLLLFSSISFAGYIKTDLANDTYITYKGYDWTWAAPISTTNFSGIDPTTDEWVDNIFEDPTVHLGWMAIIDNDIKQLFTELTLGDFQRNGEIIQSVAYWNSHFVHVDTGDFTVKVGIKGADGYVYEENDTFYVRNIASRPILPVPEPSTIMIFAIALIALSLRKRAIK